MIRFGTRIASAVAGVAALFAATASGPAIADTRPDMVVAVNALARGLEPALRSGNVDVRVSYSVFDTLIRRDFLHQSKTGEVRLIPGLATSWEMVQPNVIELELRQGVKWHDGTDFTAEDVVFSFGPERVFGKKAPARRAQPFLGRMQKVEALGTHKVRITMEGPDPILEHRLSSYTAWIVQKANYEQHRKPGQSVEEWMKAATKAVTWAPIGTGPYKLAEYRAGEHIKLASHDDYHLGKPAAKTITFKAVPEVSARIAGLVSGEFDMIVEIPPDQIPVVERYDNLKAKPIVIENSHVLVFNTKHPVLQNKKLRQAMALGIDRQKLVDTLWDGKTFTPKGPQMEIYGDLYVEDFKGFPFDKEKARQLVKESGYNGEEIEYRIIPAYYTNSMEAAQIVQAMWKDIGVNVKITPVENFKAVRAEGAAIYPWSNTVRYPDPIGQLVMSYGPRSAIQRRYKFWTSPDEFKEKTQVLETSMDKGTRKAAFRRMMEIYTDEVPATTLYNPLSTYGMREGIEFTPYTLYYMDLRPDNLQIKPGN